MKRLLSTLSVLALTAVAGFCLFGFLAAFELADPARRLPWQVGYGAVEFLSVAGMVALQLPRRGRRQRCGITPR